MRINLIEHAWLILVIKGLISILFALFALFHPSLTLALVMTFLGIYICLNGALTLLAKITTPAIRVKTKNGKALSI